MHKHRFYIPLERISNNAAVITQPEYHHIVDVLRYKKGDSIVVFDGTGIEYTGIIELIDSDRKVINVPLTKKVKEKNNKRPLILVQSLLKSNNMDLVIQKATEIGVTDIYPLIADNSIVKLDDNQKASKIEKWRRIAEEACKQCGRDRIPSIDKIWTITELLNSLDSVDVKIVCSLHERAESLQKIKSAKKEGVAIMIGPEGDFSKKELDLIHEKKWKSIRIGKTVLRAETAAIAVLGAICYKFGFWE